jgi:hypothetical protein
MATVLEEFTTEDQRPLVFFLRATALNAKDIHKEMFLIMLGNVCRLKRFHLGGKRLSDDEEVETKVRKRRGQQSKDFNALGFNALIKRWDKCINVGVEYVEKYMFFPGSNITCFTFYIHL